MTRLSYTTALIVIGAVCFFGLLSGETVERIAAVVGERVILASEVTNQVQMYMLQAGQNSNIDPQKVAQDLLNQMVSDELILAAARQDTTITAADDEVKADLDERIASLAARYPSQEAFVAQLEKEGLTKRILEKRFRPQIKDQILKRKIISKKLSKINVAREEVEKFYTQNKDSLPEIPTKVRIAHIMVKFKVSSQTEDTVKKLAEQARDLAAGGADFSEVAKRFAVTRPGVVGGHIGFIKKDEVVPEFGRAAFSLQPGAVSGVVRTDFGWHIIKSLRRIGDSVDVSQILFPLTPSAADSAHTKAVADSLYAELQKGANFKEMAKAISDDDSTRATGGEMEPLTIDQLRPEFIPALEKIDTGQTTTPIPSQLGYHILRLLDREPGRKLDINQDFDIVKNMARQEKVARLVDEWVAELKRKTFVDIRPLQLTQQQQN
jgi:peptidyl-prolyl cis-trans isomerase SurA